MNGVHDMGGMQDMGPVETEKNEPVFHHAWESRVFAMRRAIGAWRKWNIDATRYAVELVSPAEYLRQSYYERQFTAFLEMLVEYKFVTREELETSTAAPGSAKAVPAMTVEKAAQLIAKGSPTSRDVTAAPRFRTGQRVRARNINPTGHTRLPRYARGKMGTIDRDHGVFVFPDTNAQFLGEKPQHVYSVRFAARELWGSQAYERDSVYLDLWDDYLDAA
jgi:nitrile hydratase subunit beta